MPRGVKTDLDKKISDLKEKLAKKEKEVSDLKAQIKDLENQKRAEMLSKVEEVAKNKGISVEELLDSLMK